MKRIVSCLAGMLFFAGVSFADDVLFLPFGDRYESKLSTNYVVNVSSFSISTITAMTWGLARFVANPTTTTVYYTFYATPTVALIGLPLAVSSYMDIPNYFGDLYLQAAPSGAALTGNAQIRVGEMKTR